MQFVRIGCVAKKDNIKGKITEWEFPAIILGYTENWATGTYQMYNPATKQVILKGDIKWNGFDGENASNEPTLFDFTEGTGQKTTIREYARNKK